MAINVGDKAPDFTLFNTDVKNISLSDFTGKKNVVLLGDFNFGVFRTRFLSKQGYMPG